MRLKDEQGSTITEFAIGFFILSMSIFGVMAMCGALYSYLFVSEAAREAARYALVRGSSCTGFSDCGITSSQINTYVKSLNYPGIDPARLSAAATWPTGNAPGNVVTVIVTYTPTLNIPFWSRSGSTLHMSSKSQMLISQ
jgi:Flp pilus assembly protein TadG